MLNRIVTSVQCDQSAALVLVCLLAGNLCASELRRTPIVRAVERARPAVVNLHSEKTLNTADNRFATIESSRRVSGMGTGVVIDERGYIITNQHVIDGVERLQVTTASGKTYDAELVAFDRRTDLAVIKIDCSEVLPVITFGTASDLMPGEPVIAVGNAFGYEHTVTRGIVSAMHRSVQLSDTQKYEDRIQTDASINPGNSGGPLLNIDGEMIGINVAVRAGAQGIGFAIPVDEALNVAATLLTTSRVSNTWHGVIADFGKNKPANGMLVSEVEDKSPADKAGIKQGDIVVHAVKLDVARPLDFERALLDKKVGDSIKVTVQRDGEEVELEMTLDEFGPLPEPDPQDLAWEILGLRMRSVTASEFAQPRNRYRGGMWVSSVRDESPAQRQGLQRGDVLVGLHVWETISTDNVIHILNRPELKQLLPLKFYVVRSGRTLYGYLPLTD